MDKDKQIQKIPRYSIDKIAAKSELATRGLRELGLLKNKKNFTIIYVCQFCGRLINYYLTPCIFCGNYPKTKREVVIGGALSSCSLEMTHMLTVSKAVKNEEDLEIIIRNLRQLVDDVLENEDKYPHYVLSFFLADYLQKNGDALRHEAIEQMKRSNILCQKCGHPIQIADFSCVNCYVNERLSRKNIEAIKLIPNELSEKQRWIVALNNFLLFMENHWDMYENERALEALEELIFVSVYIINRLIEWGEMPASDLKNYWKNLLRKAHYIGSYEIKGAIRIKNENVGVEIADNQTEKEEFTMIMLAGNLSYLLKS